MHTPGLNVNAVAELVFDMMLHSEFEVDWQEVCVLHDSILNIITGASQADTAHIEVPAVCPR